MTINPKIYRQADSRWGNLPYPTKSYRFASNGCGCCAVTHCVIELQKYKNLTPADVRKYMVQFATKGHGTEWRGIKAGLEHYGYNVHWNQKDTMTDIKKVLKNSLGVGVLLFGSSLGGSERVRWTNSGHYVAFTDVKFNGSDILFFTKDSGGRKRDGWHSYAKTIKGDLRQIWICTSLKEQPKPTPKPEPKKPVKGTYTGVIPTPTIKSGTKGDKVKNLQKFLNWYGNYKLSVDGICGTKTVSAIKAFQKAEKITADGIYGKNSQAKAKVYKKVSP